MALIIPFLSNILHTGKAGTGKTEVLKKFVKMSKKKKKKIAVVVR